VRLHPCLLVLFIYSGCPVKNKSSIALYDHIRDNHAEDEIPGVLFFDTVAGKQLFQLSSA